MTTANDNYVIDENGASYKGYSLFDTVDDKVLQAFNRWNVLSNMTQNGMDHIGLEYIEQLGEYDRMRLAMMAEYIKRKGVEETKREIFLRAA